MTIAVQDNNTQDTALSPVIHQPRVMVQQPKVAVFMPVLNEEETLKDNLLAIQSGLKYGVIDSFILVLDGCTDSSAEIAADVFQLNKEQRQRIKENKAVSIELPNKSKIFIGVNEKPQGKGLAFARSIWTLGELDFFANPSATVVTIDADVLNLNPTSAYRLAHELIKNEEKMLLGSQLELAGYHLSDGTEATTRTEERYNGFRAIMGSDLKPLIDEDPLWMSVFPTGICMEAALNTLIYPDRKVTSTVNDPIFNVPKTQAATLTSKKPGKHVSGREQATLAMEIDWKHEEAEANPERITSSVSLYRCLADIY